MNVIDQVRRFGANALEDAQDELRKARDALLRAECHLDKHHEMNALAERIQQIDDFKIGTP